MLKNMPKSWHAWRICCLLSVAALVWTCVQAAEPVLPPAAFKPFAAARQTDDIQTLLAVLRHVGQADDEAAATTILYAGLSERILADLPEAHTQQVLTAAQEVLSQMTDKKARKVTYKAASQHPDWRVRVMLLDMAYAHVDTEKRAQTAIVRAITDSTDAVALKAIDMAGNLQLKKAVPKLMRLVIAKWGQHVGLGAAKATVALEKITGTAEPAAWHAWVNKNL